MPAGKEVLIKILFCSVKFAVVALVLVVTYKAVVAKSVPEEDASIHTVLNDRFTLVDVEVTVIFTPLIEGELAVVEVAFGALKSPI